MNVTLMQKLLAWLQQQTTIVGLGGVAAAVVGYFNHSIGLDPALTALAGSAVMALIPEKTGAVSPLHKLMADAVQAAMQRRIDAVTAAVLAGDVQALAETLSPAAPVGTTAVKAAAPAVPGVPASN